MDHAPAHNRGDGRACAGGGVRETLDGGGPLGNVHRLHRAPVYLLKTKAFFTSAGLSLLFLIVYGGCNWITARRTDVGVFYFAWEREIPFVPFMVLPYLSIDLFFVAAPFLLHSDRELKIFSRRIASAILIAGVFFLLVPLRFAFPRPQTTGALETIFDWFLALDAPFNLFPSLHAALWLLLLEVYATNLRGLVRLAVLLWFALIGLSPLLTRQHHVIDILGGLLLALACCAFLSLRRSRLDKHCAQET